MIARAGAAPGPLGRVAPLFRPGRGADGGIELSMSQNATALVLGKVATLGLGFLFWIVAAREFAAAEVGLASGAVAGMMLCVQLALLGVGSAVIHLLPEERRSPAALLDTAMTTAICGALAGGALFLALAGTAFSELSVVAGSVPYAALFLGMCVLGALGVVLDQTQTAFSRGDQMLVRGVAFGLAALAFVAAVGLLTDAERSMAIFAAWVVAGGIAVGLAAIQLRRSPARYAYRPRADRETGRRLLGVGLPNHALTLADRAPGLILPILVAETLSPTDNAYWYAAWMMAWVVYVIPVQVGISLFAEASRRPEEIGPLARGAVRTALLLGVPAAVAVAVLANLALSLLGSQYADGGAEPLRILVIALVPMALLQAYYAACRARRRLGEGVGAGVAIGVAGVVAAAIAAQSNGLTGIAVAWVAVQSAAGLWAILRLRALAGRAA